MQTVEYSGRGGGESTIIFDSPHDPSPVASNTFATACATFSCSKGTIFQSLLITDSMTGDFARYIGRNDDILIIVYGLGA